MNAASLSDEELVAWAKTIIERAQNVKLFGIVQIHFEGGRITRAKTETIEKPENSR